MKTLHISQNLRRDHRTVKRYVADSEHRWVRAGNGIMREVSARQIHRIKKHLLKCHYKTANRYFEAAAD